MFWLNLVSRTHHKSPKPHGSWCCVVESYYSGVFHESAGNTLVKCAHRRADILPRSPSWVTPFSKFSKPGGLEKLLLYIASMSATCPQHSTWQKQPKEGKAHFGSQFTTVVTLPWQEAAGHIESTVRKQRWKSTGAQPVPFYSVQDPAHEMMPPPFSVGFSPQ